MSLFHRIRYSLSYSHAPAGSNKFWTGLGTLVTCAFLSLGLTPQSLAQETDLDAVCDPAQGSASTCCASADLTAAMPGETAMLRHSFCELLLFPTFSLLENEDFTSQISTDTLVEDQHASAYQMTRPSLWWNRDILPERLGGNRLVESWLAYEIEGSGTRVVDMAIDPQIWGVLTYIEKYAVLNRLATAAEDFGYNLRLFYAHPRNSILSGLYVCDFETDVAAAKQASRPLSETPNSQSCVATFDTTAIIEYQRAVLNPDNQQPTLAAPEDTASPLEAASL